MNPYDDVVPYDYPMPYNGANVLNEGYGGHYADRGRRRLDRDWAIIGALIEIMDSDYV